MERKQTCLRMRQKPIMIKNGFLILHLTKDRKRETIASIDEYQLQ